MSAPDLIFSQPALVGPPALVFGEDGVGGVTPVAPADPRALVFRERVADIADPRALVFAPEPADDVAPPVIPDFTLVGGGKISGLRGHMTLRVVAVARAAGVISGLRGHMTLRSVAVARAVGAISGLRGHMTLTYDNCVTRYLGAGVAARHGDAVPQDARIEGTFDVSRRILGGVDAQWKPAIGAGHPIKIGRDAALARSAHCFADWERAASMQAESSAAHQRADSLAAAAAMTHQTARSLVRGLASRMQSGIELRRMWAASWQVAIEQQHLVQGRSGASVRLRGRQFDVMPWQLAMHPASGRSTAPARPPAGHRCYTPDPALVFDSRWSGASAALVFACDRLPAAGVTVPIRKAYIVINSITLHRVDTGAELHAHGFSMALDYQSWTWSWQASLHHDAAAHLGRDAQGSPVELEATVNGLPFRLRLELVARDRRFSPTRWAVSGRGLAAILDEPWAPAAMAFGNAEPRSAQQLMAEALTINGASLGWEIDWGLTDWPVPAGAWSFRGSYIGAVNDIAGAAGGYVQPHPTDAVLRVLPRYPAAPWAWGDVTPDFEIPAAAAEVEGTEYLDKPAYNRVFVGGVGQGVFGPFKRAGTAGDVLAPQVSHQLITHADAHRQRGLAEISDTGRQEHITLSMQVLPETGIIMPGQFVRYAGDSTVMGIVRGTSIDWSRPKLRQNIRIETHA